MINSTLKTLDLSYNKIGDAGTIRISEAIRVNTSLEELCFLHNLVDARGATTLSEALMVNSTLFDFNLDTKGMDLPSNVKEILRGKAYMNRLEKQIIPRILNNDPALTFLELNPDHLNEAALTRLCEALKHNSTITSLVLSCCWIGDRGAAIVSEMLELNVSLTAVDLRRNDITNIGAVSIANALKINPTLTALDLNHNKIKYEGKESLNNALIWNQTLLYFRLEDNRFEFEKFLDILHEDWIVRKNQSLFHMLFQSLNKYNNQKKEFNRQNQLGYLNCFNDY